MASQADAARPAVRLDETGRYRLSPDVPAEGLVRRYRRQFVLMAMLLLALAAWQLWQLWQAREAAVSGLERQAALQAASLPALARTVTAHLADLRGQAERTPIPGAAGAPDAALPQAVHPRTAADGHRDGYALDVLPPLLHSGSAQWLWPRAEAQPPDVLAASQVLGRMPEVDGAAMWRAINARWPELARRTLFVTGDTLSPGARQFLDQTGCNSLDKPFARGDLLARVAALLGHGANPGPAEANPG